MSAYDETRDIEEDYPNHGKEQFSINVIGWKEGKFEIGLRINDDTFSNRKQLGATKEAMESITPKYP